MFEIDRIPEEVKAMLPGMGIRPEELLLAAHSDKARSQEPADTYLLATKETLYILSRAAAPAAPKGTFAVSEKVWSMESHPLSELTRITAEEQRSTGRLLAHRGEELLLLAAYSNFCKESMLLFVKYINPILKGEEKQPEEKDLPESKCCPKCGMRYPDVNRPICPHCMEKGKLFLRMAGFFAKYRLRLILVLLSLVLLTAMSILVPYLSGGFFYDEVLDTAGEFYGQILFLLILIISTKLLNMLATILNHTITSTVAAKMVFDLKKTIFGAIQRLSLGFFSSRQTGGLMTQINEDSNTIYEFFCDYLPFLIINIVQVAVLIILLFLIQPLLALLALASVPIFFVIMNRVFKVEKKLHARRYGGSSKLNSFLADVLSGMRIVKAFSREQQEISRFTDRSEALAESDRKLSLFHNFAGHASGIVLYIGNIVSWGVGGWMVLQAWGGMTYGLLTTFIAYINMIYNPLHFFADMANRGADCTNAMQRLFEIMDAQPDVSEAEEPLEPEQLGGSVEFSDVSFSYVKGKQVIDHVSFTVEEGKTLGIVGHTGAGKSTLANLIMRLYDADEGEVRVGGIPVKQLSFQTLHDSIAIVSQETYLFIGTIMDNIRYAKPDATYEEVIEASKNAGAHDFIMKLPDAYHTRIGFGNQELSGGERQRLSIARAILKDPKILILDEATAAMDTATERRIQEAITRLTEGKTTIMIAHRLSTLRDADSLVVIEHGKLAESGTHRELLEREDGVYRKLYDLQLEALRNAGIAE